MRTSGLLQIFNIGSLINDIKDSLILRETARILQRKFTLFFFFYKNNHEIY